MVLDNGHEKGDGHGNDARYRKAYAEMQRGWGIAKIGASSHLLGEIHQKPRARHSR